MLEFLQGSADVAAERLRRYQHRFLSCPSAQLCCYLVHSCERMREWKTVQSHSSSSPGNCRGLERTSEFLWSLASFFFQLKVDKIMDEQSSPSALARATILLGTQEQLSVSGSGDQSSLSSALVELKGKCMEFLGDYLLKQNTPLEEPDVVLGTEAGSDEEEEPLSGSVATKKRKS